MKQALQLGRFLRETYVESMGFLPPTLGSGSEPSFSSTFMSDSGELFVVHVVGVTTAVPQVLLSMPPLRGRVVGGMIFTSCPSRETDGQQ